MKKPRPWVTSVLLAATVILGKRTVGVLALPHEVVPVPRTTDALSLTLYVKSSEILYHTPMILIVSYAGLHDVL